MLWEIDNILQLAITIAKKNTYWPIKLFDNNYLLLLVNLSEYNTR